MKTNEELNAIKEEVEALNKKLAELSEDELQQVSGGVRPVPRLPGFELPGDEYAGSFRTTIIE